MSSLVAALLKGYVWLNSTWFGRLILKQSAKWIIGWATKLISVWRNRVANKKESKAQLKKLRDKNVTETEEVSKAIDDALSKL